MTASHLIVIGQGRLIADSSVADLTAQVSRDVVLVRTEEAARLRGLLTRDGVGITASDADRLVVTGLSSAAIGRIAADAAIALVELIPQQASLEEAFMEITRDAVEFNTHRRERRDDRGNARPSRLGCTPAARGSACPRDRLRMDQVHVAALDLDQLRGRAVRGNRPRHPVLRAAGR